MESKKITIPSRNYIRVPIEDESNSGICNSGTRVLIEQKPENRDSLISYTNSYKLPGFGQLHNDPILNYNPDSNNYKEIATSSYRSENISEVNSFNIIQNAKFSDINTQFLPQPNNYFHDINFNKKNFENLCEKLRKECNEKIKKNEKEFKKKFFSIKGQFDKKIEEINDLEKFVLSQFPDKPQIAPIQKIIQPSVASLKNLSSKIPSTPQEHQLIKIQNPLPQSSSQTKFMVNQAKTYISVSRNLKTIDKLNVPGKLKSSSALMILNDKEILLAYSTGQVFTINVFTNNSTQLQNFKIRRSQFTMCFVDEYPAIIAGELIETKKVDTTVEVLVNGEWKLAEKLNIGRSQSRSIKHKNCSFVFGGFNLESIEKYEKNWTVLGVNLPLGLYRFALCAENDKIYMFGGEGKFRKSVHVFDIERESLEVGKDLEKIAKDNSGQSVQLMSKGRFLILRATCFFEYIV